ncbi:MAG: mannose-6-phosphate isomerase, class I [Sphaerochaetaceae bacterium]|nr:mannose-6-phosphate isomerase, class I [Sphaerochaetaceae bacterium]
MSIVPIVPKVQKYSWGDDSYIPSLLKKAPDGEPWAELWFGTHPGGESTLDDGTPLGDFLREQAVTFLGEDLINHYGKDLPFLLKVLSIAQPLSLQVHPSALQAEEGYAREVAQHIEIPREQWNYKDNKQKAEVLYALTPITAMCGFLPIEQLIENFSHLLPSQFPLIFPYLQNPSAPEEELLEQFFTTLYSMDIGTRKMMVAEYGERLTSVGGPSETSDGLWLTRSGIARKCLELYPDDLGVFAPYFMHILHLKPTEAIFLPPRTLHAYIKGHGIELMTNSDNVLRGGLTPKKIDVPELLKILTFDSRGGQICPQVYDVYGCKNILAPTSDFLLGVCNSGSYFVQERKSIEFLFCIEGNGEIVFNNNSIKIGQGECVVVAAAVEHYRLTVQGTVFRATVPV